MAPPPAPTIAVWGLTFKANTDDRRDSPSLQISPPPRRSGGHRPGFRPNRRRRRRTPPRTCRTCSLRSDPYEAVAGARALVVLTEWDEFRWLDFPRVLAAMAEPNIVDARNLLDPAAVRRMGFTYSGIGRQ